MRKIYLYLVSVLVLLIILYRIWPLPFNAFSKSVLMPTVNILVLITEKALTPLRTIGSINSLAQKNKSLEIENNQLKADLVKQQDLFKNNSLLANEIEKSKNVPSIQARVIGRTPGGLNATLLLDKGTDDGVRSGSAVLTGGYFIGKVASVSEKKSEVILIFSHSSLIPVIMAQNNEGGLLQGGLEGLIVTDIPISSKTDIGGEITTSGLGGDLPSGLLVGKVGIHLGIEGDLFQKIRVDSPINPYQITYVSVSK